MPLIKSGAIADDPWVRLDDQAEEPPSRPVIVSLTRWQKDRNQLAGRAAGLGILLLSDQAPAAIVDDLAEFDIIALEFPKFTDGRPYSYARLLRERYGFAGELRAVGNVLRDQLWFMQRCGFDAFELPTSAPVDDWLQALSEVTVRYQPTGDRRPWATALRHHGSL